MNILIYSSNSHYEDKVVGGSEISLRLIAEKFAELNENISYATLSQSKLPRPKKRVINGVKVYSLSPFRWPNLNGKLFPKTRVKFVECQLRKFLVEILEKEKVNIVHTYDTYKNTFDILQIRHKYNLNFKVVQRIAGLIWIHQLKNRAVSSDKIEWVFNNVDALNFVSPGLRRLFYLNVERLKLTVKPKKEIMLDIGVGGDFLKSIWNPNTRDQFRIVCVARFSSLAKRQDLLINALPILKNKAVSVEFIGDGTTLAFYKKKAIQIGIEDRITFHGFVSQRKLRHILLNADLFTLPTEYEGVPKALLEAMAMGLPCLISDVSPLNEYLKEGVNGYLCANSPESWAKKIQMISDEKNRLKDISKHAKEFVVQNYNAERNIFSYKEEFENLMK